MRDRHGLRQRCVTVNRNTGALDGVRRTGKREQGNHGGEDQLVIE
jgi:hypothetical protein